MSAYHTVTERECVSVYLYDLSFERDASGELRIIREDGGEITSLRPFLPAFLRSHAVSQADVADDLTELRIDLDCTISTEKCGGLCVFSDVDKATESAALNIRGEWRRLPEGAVAALATELADWIEEQEVVA